MLGFNNSLNLLTKNLLLVRNSERCYVMKINLFKGCNYGK